ncbi:energy-coupling factor ABC transporter ATP-binding protein [Kosmotoga pacifica]|uniref:energy-coupling factor ABC transporter ATP-binding protein n=1 Tax=Kosmotoga pacifica TaxID=1330330 RepID=UPI00069A8A9E|nr:ABC transporter ATP-binding protein [Kosmotoga pacifica]
MIKFRNVTFFYEPDYSFQSAALKNINLSIKRNSVTLVLGSNGAGKSTFLLLASGLFQPTIGSVVINGYDTCKSHAKNIRKLVGIAFQRPESYFFCETVEEEVCYAAKKFGLDNIHERFNKMMQALGLKAERIKNLSPFSLSGGEARRVAIGGSIIHNPDVILLDEPTVSLDIEGILHIRKLLIRLKAEGKTIIISTHWPEYFLDIASDIIGFNEGQQYFHGSVEEFLKKPTKWYEMLGLYIEEDLYQIREHFLKAGIIRPFEPVG